MLSRPSNFVFGRQFRGETVTIAAGFVCANGVVLAADSQFSGYIKSSGTKVWSYGEGEKVMAVAAAGAVVLINAFIDGIERNFGVTQPEHLLQMANDVLYPLWIKHIRDNDGADLFLLVVIRTSSGVTLYENQGAGTLATLRKQSQCYGAGKGLGNYLAEQLFRSSMSVQAARNVAVFLLKQTKKFESDSCGGDSQILLIPTRVDASLHLVDQSTIQALEAQLEGRERAAAGILAGIGIPGVDINEETALRRQETVDTALSAMNTTYVQLSGVQATMKIDDRSLKVELEEVSGVIQPAPEPED